MSDFQAQTYVLIAQDFFEDFFKSFTTGFLRGCKFGSSRVKSSGIVARLKRQVYGNCAISLSSQFFFQHSLSFLRSCLKKSSACFLFCAQLVYLASYRIPVGFSNLTTATMSLGCRYLLSSFFAL